jgi:hypothetical protein
LAKGELIADSSVNQRRSHGGIHAAGQAQNNFLCTGVHADFCDGFIDVSGHVPITGQPANTQYKTLQ